MSGNDKVLHGAFILMGAMIQSGQVKYYDDMNRDKLNKYCIEKAKQLYFDYKKVQK